MVIVGDTSDTSSPRLCTIQGVWDLLPMLNVVITSVLYYCDLSCYEDIKALYTLHVTHTQVVTV